MTNNTLNLPKKDIIEISDSLQLGERCFINKNTLKIESYPKGIEDHSDQLEYWEDIINEINNNTDIYIEIENMSSSESFKVMESFTNLIENDKIKRKLQGILNKSKPFSNWKNIVENDFEYRGDWFNFRDEQFEKWISKQLDKIQRLTMSHALMNSQNNK